MESIDSSMSMSLIARRRRCAPVRTSTCTTLSGSRGPPPVSTTASLAASMKGPSDVYGSSMSSVRPAATSTTVRRQAPSWHTVIATRAASRNAYVARRKAHCGRPHSASIGATGVMPWPSAR